MWQELESEAVSCSSISKQAGLVSAFRVSRASSVGEAHTTLLLAGYKDFVSPLALHFRRLLFLLAVFLLQTLVNRCDIFR